MRASRWLMSATVVVAMFAVVACCKKKEEDAAAETPEAGIENTESIPVPDPSEVAPDWKTKCPDAERPASGTRTATRNLDIREKPDDTAKTIGGISSTTKFNLLGVKQNWVCIDFPSTNSPTGLAPGWVLAAYIASTTVVKDAGTEAAVATATPDAAVVVDAATAVVDAAAAATDGGSKLVALPDAGKTATTPTTTTTTKAPPGIRPPVPRPPR